jgi:hypothetical protein
MKTIPLILVTLLVFPCGSHFTQRFEWVILCCQQF